MRVKDRVAIVTAAAGAGIGQAIARTLAQEGANVVVTDVHPRRCIEVAGDISKTTGREALGLQVDVTNHQQVDDMVKQVIARFGRIDILVNNAGINKLAPVWEMDDETWDLVINVNLKGTFMCTRAVLPGMIKQRSGRIVSISSVAGLAPEEEGGTHYSAAKAGILGFTRGVANEVAKYDILVNAVAPGFVPNPFLARIYPAEALKKLEESVPLKRAQTPQDIATATLWLVSDENQSVTGQCLCVSGGMFMH
ncbi:MAG: 3-oxoacyl-ACP reductase FabG [Chloroflexi bacterium]|nr:3-oxoacyl-ACP reductase FabG [Chloroflexota bacterium]